MRVLGQGLTAIGRHGPALLVLSLLLGGAVAPLATAAYEVLPLSAFLLTLGSFLTAGLAPPEKRLGRRRILLALAWAGLGVPLMAAAIVVPLHLDPALQAGVILSVLAPPVGSAAAIAAILGLRPRLALIASLALTLVAPLSMPAFATILGINVSIDMVHLAWRLALIASLALTLVAPLSIPAFATILGINVSIDMVHLAWRLALIIGLAAILAQMARHWRSKVQAVLPDQSAAAGVAVIGLVIVGLAMMSGIRAYWAADPETFSLFIAAAIGVNLGAGFVGALLFSSWGAKDAFTVGLVSGNRNVTLAWAAAGSTLPVATEAYVAACVIPVLALPLAIKSVLAVRAQLIHVIGKRKPAQQLRIMCVAPSVNATSTASPER